MSTTHEIQNAALVLRQALECGQLSSREVEELLHQKAPVHPMGDLVRRLFVTLGAVISFAGLGVLMAQHWSEFGTFLRVFLTLGTGLVSYAVAMLLHREEGIKKFAIPFYLLAMAFVPSGFAVTLYEARYSLSAHETQMFISFALCLLFSIPALLLRSNLMGLSTIWAATWLFFSTTNYLVSGNATLDTRSFYEYRAFICGLWFVVLAYLAPAFRFGASSGPLYFLGSAAALMAGFSLMDWSPHQNVLWELAYPPLCAAFMMVGLKIRSRALVANGALALNAYIAKISSAYFAASLGWPLAMIFTGFAIMGVALGSIGLYRNGATS